ncbi:hypothetical protein HDU67_003475 [Dinochytrium kinnereticum]|nr:hypothetical protein HDU67_003475 [Dinochytrium kinnereticum]
MTRPQESAEEYASSLISYVNSHKALLNFSAGDFIVDDQWERIVPAEWMLLEAESLETIAQVASTGFVKAEWPESLKKFIAESQQLGISGFHAYGIGMPELNDINGVEDWAEWSRIPDGRKEEVLAFARIVAEVAKSTGTSNVVDFGTGEGHVAIALSDLFGLNIVAVDRDPGALQKGEDVFRRLSERRTSPGHNHDERVRRVGSVTFKEVRVSIEDDGYSHALDEILEDGTEDTTARVPFIMCGLQTCGDLAGHIIQTFLESSAIALVNVGCCYHMMSASQEKGGFPMSAALRSLDCHLSLNALATASQLKHPKHTSQEELLVVFKGLLYRSILSCVIKEKGLCPSNDGDGEISIAQIDVSQCTPVSYIREALKCLGVDDGALGDHDIHGSFMWNEAACSTRVAAAWTLRWLLAEAIEAIVLIDRWMTLKERLEASGASGDVRLGAFVPDGTCSRTCMFIATKKIPPDPQELEPPIPPQATDPNDKKWDEICFVVMKQTREGRVNRIDPQTSLRCFQRIIGKDGKESLQYKATYDFVAAVKEIASMSGDEAEFIVLEPAPDSVPVDPSASPNPSDQSQSPHSTTNNMVKVPSEKLKQLMEEELRRQVYTVNLGDSIAGFGASSAAYFQRLFKPHFNFANKYVDSFRNGNTARLMGNARIIKSETVYNAMLKVDRAKYVANGTSNPYGDHPTSIDGANERVLIYYTLMSLSYLKVFRHPWVEASWHLIDQLYMNGKNRLWSHHLCTPHACNVPGAVKRSFTFRESFLHSFRLPIGVSGCKALDVGSGSGYLTAIMGYMVRGHGGQAVGVDHIPELVKFSQQNCKADCPELLKDGTVKLITADGRLVIPVGTHSQELMVIDKDSSGHLRHHSATGVVYVPLTSKEHQMAGEF